MPKPSTIIEFAKSLHLILRQNGNEVYLKDLPKLINKHKAHCSQAVKQIKDEGILPIDIVKDESYTGRGRKPHIVILRINEVIEPVENRNNTNLPAVPSAPPPATNNPAPPLVNIGNGNNITEDLRDIKGMLVSLVKTKSPQDDPVHTLPSDAAIEPTNNRSKLQITEDDYNKLPTGPRGLPILTELPGMSLEDSQKTMVEMNCELQECLALRNLKGITSGMDVTDNTVWTAQQVIKESIQRGILLRIVKQTKKKLKVDELAASALCFAGSDGDEILSIAEIERVSQVKQAIILECTEMLSKIVDRDKIQLETIESVMSS